MIKSPPGLVALKMSLRKGTPVDGGTVIHKAAQITVTPAAGFIVDRLWENGSVLAASACSGHGFKHSPALGEELAALALEPGRALEPSWALSRFG